MFEMVPQTPMDIYRNKMQSDVIKSQLTSTHDEMVEQTTQTEHNGTTDSGAQVPDIEDPDQLLDKYKKN